MTRRGFVILLPFPRIQLSNISLLYLLLLLLLPLFFIFPVVQTKNLGVILHFLSTTLHIQSISKFYKFYFKADPELKYSSPLFQPHSIAANLVIIFFLDYCTNLLIFLTRMPVSAVGSLWSTLKTTARVIILFKKLLFWNNYRFTRNYKDSSGRFHVPFIQFPSMVQSYIIIKQYWNQEFDMGSMCEYLYVILSRVHLWNYHCNQDMELFRVTYYWVFLQA